MERLFYVEIPDATVQHLKGSNLGTVVHYAILGAEAMKRDMPINIGPGRAVVRLNQRPVEPEQISIPVVAEQVPTDGKPTDGWWPDEEEDILLLGMRVLFRGGKAIASIVKNSKGWRSHGTQAVSEPGLKWKPIKDRSALTRSAAQKQADDYIAQLK